MVTSCISPADVTAMVEPIAGEHEVGSDLRNNLSPTSNYQALRDARTQARNNERTALSDGETFYFNLSDWKTILDKVPQILADESKDIEVVAWYIEALTRHYGFQGFAQGFSLARQLIERYGEALYPHPDEDGIATQLAPLIGLNGFGGEGALIAPIKSIPMTEGDPPGPLAAWQCEQVFEVERISDPDKREARLKQGGVSRAELDQVMVETSTPFIHTLQGQIELALEEYTQFQRVIDQYSEEDPQPTGHITDALKGCQQVLTYIAGDRLQNSADATEVQSMDESQESGDKTDVPRVSPKGFTIENRDEALTLLRDVASFFRRTEPHSPISYSVEQAIRWSGLPLSELIKELIPDDASRKKYQHLSGIQSDSNND